MSYSHFVSAAYQQHQQHYQQRQLYPSVSVTSQLLVDSTPFLPHQSSTSGISPSSPTSDARHQLPGDVISPSLSGEVDQQAGTQAMYGSTAAASSLLAYPAARVAALTAATDYTSYTAAAAATGQTYVPFDSSAFYSPLSSDTGDTWRSLSQTTACTGWPYDTGMSGYPYGPSYGGLDVRRKNATRESTSTLKAWLYEHIKNPYPTKGEKIMLAIITKMTLTQVSTWFANARRRLKKENKMQWSPRNRTDNDDDDKSSSDDNDEFSDSNKCDSAGLPSQRQLNKDDDEDIVVDNIDCSNASAGLMTDLQHRLSSCSRLRQQQQQQQPLHAPATDCHQPLDSSRLHLPVIRPTGGTVKNVDLVGGSAVPLHPSSRCSVLSPAAGFMSTCSPTSSFYYRPTYFRSNSTSVSGLPLPAHDDVNEVDEPVASSEEEENKPRIWSIADVATSCRPLQQRLAGSIGQTGFLHPWSNASTSFNYPHYPQATVAAAQGACSAATARFYSSYYQQHQHRPVTAPVAMQQSIVMATGQQQLVGDSVRCTQLQNAVGNGLMTSHYSASAPVNAYDVTSNDGITTHQPVQCIPAGSVFPAMTSSRSDAEPYVITTSSSGSAGININDSQTAFKPVVKRL